MFPRSTNLGEEAIEKTLGKCDMSIDDSNKLYAVIIADELIGNGICYAGTATNKAGLLSGLLMGIGTILLPSTIELMRQ